jgi:hypothetical protein
MAGERLGIRADEAETLVAEIHRNAGLIADTGDGERFCFAHRSVHEFCAARELARRGDAGLTLVLANIDEPDWTQVLIFYASLEHDGAERLVEALLERGFPGHIQRLALAGQCAAVLTRPLAALRDQVAEALSAVLGVGLHADRDRALLTALIMLHGSGSERMQTDIERAVHRLLEHDNPEHTAAELGRLDRPTALAILELFIGSGEPERLRAILAGLQAMDGIERVPLLWRLVGLMAERSDREPHLREDLGQAVGLLGMILDDPAAAERLNAQPAQLAQCFDPAVVRNVYPFVASDQPPSNVARFLALYVHVIKEWILTRAHLALLLAQARGNPFHGDGDISSTWVDLLKSAVESKEGDRHRDWQRLAFARSRPAWRLPWRGVARGVVLSAFVFGGLLLWLMLHLGGLTAGNEDIWIVFVQVGLFCGCAIALFWWPWDFIARHAGAWSAQAGAVPNTLGRLLRPSSRSGAEERSSGRPRRALLGLGRFVARGILWSSSILLLPIALLVTYPSLSGHGWNTSGVAFAPDGQRLATASYDDTARLWDAETGAELLRLDGHTGSVYAVAFSPDGRRMLTGSGDDTARIWDAESGAELLRLDGHQGWVKAVAFSPDGRRVLTGSADHTTRLWDTETGAELLRFEGHQSWVKAVAVSPDGRRLLTGSLDATARLWDAETGAELRQLDGHSDSVDAVAFSPDGRRVLTGSGDDTVRLWDAETGAELRRLDEHRDSVNAIAFSPDGRRVLVGYEDGSVRLLDAETGAPMRVIAALWTPATWNAWDVVVFALLVILLVYVPTLKWFEKGRWLYLRRPNAYLWLYDLPGIEHYIPVDPLPRDKRR